MTDTYLINNYHPYIEPKIVIIQNHSNKEFNNKEAQLISKGKKRSLVKIIFKEENFTYGELYMINNDCIKEKQN